MIRIIVYHPKYAAQLIDVFKNAIQAIDGSIYSAIQKNAWIGDTQSAKAVANWQKRFAVTCPLVAIDTSTTTAIGFIECIINQNQHGDYCSNQAYIDCLYVHPKYHYKGVAQNLYQAGIKQLLEAQQQGLFIESIWVHAATNAIPFFSKQGFIEVEAQQVKRIYNEEPVILKHHLMRLSK